MGSLALEGGSSPWRGFHDFSPQHDPSTAPPKSTMTPGTETSSNADARRKSAARRRKEQQGIIEPIDGALVREKWHFLQDRLRPAARGLQKGSFVE